MYKIYNKPVQIYRGFLYCTIIAVVQHVHGHNF